jgi:phosphoribosylamine--glycine ligase
MKVLVVGAGGREHALAWKAAQSPLVSEVIVAPGNAGTAREPKARNVAVSATDIDALLELASYEGVELTIVGPEQPLVAGIVDRFENAGLSCFGPCAAAAQLEGSKAFAKAFLARHRIPTAKFATFDELEPALAYVRGQELPIVIKADGLAAGKGVVVAEDLNAAEQALEAMLRGRAFGGAGAQVVVEEFLGGEEASFIAVVDGEQILPLASSQDHKRRDDGDQGPNTGGMGAYSPAPVVTEAVHERIMERIMLPTVRGLADDGLRYRGFLYAGLMIDGNGDPRVLEFNCRFGDPETQPILFRLREDLVKICLMAFRGDLHRASPEWDPRTSLGVVMASGGYPGGYEKGEVIEGLDRIDDETVKVFHAGTRLEGDRVLTDGGRVLCVVALGDTVRAAREKAYRGVSRIKWEGAFYRTDIGYRAVDRETSASG